MLNGLMRILGRAGLGVGLACAAAALIPTPAAAGDPGRWDLVDRSTIPLVYFQGVTSAPDGDLFFDGINTGLYRSNSQLAQEARIANVIPSPVGTAQAPRAVRTPARPARSASPIPTPCSGSTTSSSIRRRSAR